MTTYVSPAFWAIDTGGGGFLRMNLPVLATNKENYLPDQGGYWMAAAALPAAGLVLYSDANGMPTSSATFAYSGTCLSIKAQDPLVAPAAGTARHTVGADGVQPIEIIDSFGTLAPLQIGRLARGTKGSPTAAVANDSLMQIQGYGWDTVAYGQCANISIRALGTNSATDHGGQFVVRAAPAGSVTLADVMVSKGGGAFLLPLHPTTASAANMFIDSSTGAVARSTSGEKYKEDIENMSPEIAEKVISAARPVWYRSVCETDQLPAPATKDGRQSFYGLIAEEVAAIDPRFAFWTQPEESYEWIEEWSPAETVTRVDEDGEEWVGTTKEPELQSRSRVLRADADRSLMVPDGVQYDRMVAPLILVAQSHKAQLDEQAAQIAGQAQQLSTQAVQIAALQEAVAKIIKLRVVAAVQTEVVEPVLGEDPVAEDSVQNLEMQYAATESTEGE